MLCLFLINVNGYDGFYKYFCDLFTWFFCAAYTWGLVVVSFRIKMNYDFVKNDLMVEGKCESCDRMADHVLVLVHKTTVGVFQICYDCSVMVDFGGKDYRFIPKKDAVFRNERCTPMCDPRK